MKLVLSILFFISLARANNPHEAESHESSFEKIEVEKSPKEFKIPSDLWDLILNEQKAPQEEPKKEKEAEASKESAKVESPILVWMPIKVQLQATSEEILKNKKTEFEFSMGGGEIDFSRIVVGEKGSFFIKFLLEEFKDPSKVKVYFYSKAKKRKIDDDIFGSGCNVYFDITKKFFVDNTKQGIKTNVTDNRHLSVFGGHFIFASHNEGKVYVTQVSFRDSTKPELFCQE